MSREAGGHSQPAPRRPCWTRPPRTGSSGSTLCPSLNANTLMGEGWWWRMKVWSVSARVGWNIPEDPLDGLEWGPKLRETMACFSLL